MADGRENSASSLPGGPGEQPAKPPRQRPPEDQLLEAARRARNRPFAILFMTAAVAVPTLVAQLSLARLFDRPLVWLGYPFTIEKFADILSGLALIAVNSAAIVVLSGLLAPLLTERTSEGGSFRALLRLFALTCLLGGLGLALCLLIPRFQNMDDWWHSLLFSVLFYLGGFAVVAAVGIRFAFAAPGVTLRGASATVALRESRRLTRGLFFRILALRLVTQVLLESFGGVIGAAVVNGSSGLIDFSASDLGFGGWMVVAILKWGFLIPVLAVNSALAVVQFLEQSDYLRDRQSKETVE
ncbi:glycerophosphoryl diester phosphodiesterase membrane domain-containing protein [Sphaerisporangium sp. NBC_01403]|uniref:glycerophosphoryl diester phosphodiesterase membrane domain-containing protein n=1 Tax=Sphaerisporangium sp. NBC_01403 TaxID=2903599 RepID=UPI0032529198